MKTLRDENLVDPSLNVSMFYNRWKEENDGREERNPFIQWLQHILGITTTTTSAPLSPAENCSQCSCGKTNRNKIVGGTETNVKYDSWLMVRSFFASNRTLPSYSVSFHGCAFCFTPVASIAVALLSTTDTYWVRKILIYHLSINLTLSIIFQ